MVSINTKYLWVLIAATLCPFATHAADWWSIPFGGNTGGVSALYVEKTGIAVTGRLRPPAAS